MDYINIQAPIIVVGAGRSGSTLLVRLLNAHPSISMKGETRFLVPRIWEIAYKERYWQKWQQFVDSHPTSSESNKPTLNNAELSELRDTTASQVAGFVYNLVHANDVYVNKAGIRLWGFKEIWNGTQTHDYSWDDYHDVFPHATWVHLIRHPYDFAISCAKWNCVDLTRQYADRRMKDWVRITNRSCELHDQKRWYEMHYEDLIRDPKQMMQALVRGGLGLGWYDGYLEPMQRRTLSTQNNAAISESRDETWRAILQSVEKPAGFFELIEKYQYTL